MIYHGTYWSPELDVIYRIAQSAEERYDLVVDRGRGQRSGVHYRGPDTFGTAGRVIRFDHDEAVGVRGFIYESSWIGSMRFERLDPAGGR